MLRPLLVAALVLGSVTSVHAQSRINIGQTLRGTLAASHPTLDDGSHYQIYAFSGRAGQMVTVTLRSSDFDAYLAVGRMNNGAFESLVTDDDGAGGTDSRASLTLPSSGEYLVRANTLAAGETGNYTVEVSAGAGAATAPTNGTVGMLLDSATSMMARAGLRPLGDAMGGSLRAGGETTLSIPVNGGTVVFMGVCDESCTDVDLVVYGPDGGVMGQDVLADDAPLVRVENAVRGTYRVKVVMPACSATCEFGVRTFGQ